MLTPSCNTLCAAFSSLLCTSLDGGCPFEPKKQSRYPFSLIGHLLKSNKAALMTQNEEKNRASILFSKSVESDEKNNTFSSPARHAAPSGHTPFAGFPRTQGIWALRNSGTKLVLFGFAKDQLCLVSLRHRNNMIMFRKNIGDDW